MNDYGPFLAAFGIAIGSCVRLPASTGETPGEKAVPHGPELGA